MLKVSFKDDFKKVQAFNGKATVVTLTGRMGMILEHVPHHIWTWVLEHPSVNISVAYHDSHECWIIEVSGKSVCAEGDAFDATKGERIAESRAKIRLYKFMRTFFLMLHDYYSTILTGTDTYFDSSPGKPSIIGSYFRYCELLSKERGHLVKLLQET